MIITKINYQSENYGQPVTCLTQAIFDLIFKLFSRLGFLKYYTEVFDWKQHVVSIRDTSPLTRKVKGWHKTRLAIEDPFLLSHNLAAGVSPRMGLYILKAFRRARTHFGTPIEMRLNETGLNYVKRFYSFLFQI